MIFIAGMQPKTVRVEKVAHACPACAHFEVYQKRIDHYISFFFLPLLRVKKGEPFITCDHCGVILDAHGTMSGAGMGTSQPAHQCRSCQRDISPNFAYCPHCGKRV